MKAAFSSDLTETNVEGMVFREDATLAELLDSDEVRLAYTKCYLHPFIEQHTAEQCRDILLNPAPEIIDATKRVVAQMANGGVEPPDGIMNASE